MSNEVVESKGAMLVPVTEQDVEAMKSQRELLKKFISSQLREANFKDSKSPDYGEGDYGIVPGTNSKTLLKPGAEKLLKLFSLAVRVRQVDKEIDRHANFAMFTYRAEVYNPRTNIVVAECEATANSMEKKYRERTVWKKKTVNGRQVSESVKEETPIFDILNTLMKMTQKRAIVGAAILATGASDFFTQDMEADETEEAAVTEPKPAAEREVGEVKDPAGDAPPTCCGKEMMVSKYPNRETGNHDWYCLKCKTSQARTA